MANPEGKTMEISPDAVRLLQEIKNTHNIPSDEEALDYCFVQAAFSLSTPEDWVGDNDEDAATVLARALAHPETLIPMEEVFATLRREREARLEPEQRSKLVDRQVA